MTKINLLKKREGILLVGLLECNLQIATVCIPAYAVLGKFWLAVDLAWVGVLHLVLLVPAPPAQILVHFVIGESTCALNLFA